MIEMKNMKVELIDDDHIFFGDKQFVSLNRLSQVKIEMAKEVQLLVDKNKELAKENEALRVLLKNQLNDVI